MKTPKLLPIALIVFLAACSSNDSPSFYSEKQADSTSYGNSVPTTNQSLLSSSAAVEDGSDPNRRFIGTADVKFRVKDVLQATYQIEDIVNQNDGFVTNTQLKSEVESTISTPVSIDSTLETTYYTMVNHMVLRVPNTNLDATLKSIAGLVDFMDYRVIQANDVALDLLANELEQKRLAKHETRLENAIDKKNSKLEETTNTEENLLRKQERADRAMLDNKRMEDKIAFSTVSMNIYQRQELKRELLANAENIHAFEPEFGTKVNESFIFGWNILEAIVLTITKLWSLIVIGGICFIIYRVFLRK